MFHTGQTDEVVKAPTPATFSTCFQVKGLGFQV